MHYSNEIPTALPMFSSDVNKDWTPKDKELTLKDKDKDLPRVA